MSQPDEMTGPKNNDKKYSAPALEKGLDILELLSQQDQGLALSDLANELQRTKNEIYRMVSVLAARGYIARSDESDRYQVTEKMFQMGSNRPPIRHLIEVSQPIMAALVEEIQHSCHLAVMSGDQIVVVSRCESPTLIGVTVRLGFRRPIETTGSGLVMLAHMTRGQRFRTIQSIQKRDPLIDLDWLDQQIQMVPHGQALSLQSSVLQGVLDISVPIRQGEKGECVAALTAPCAQLIDHYLDDQAIGTVLSRAAEKISVLLAK